MARFKVTHSEDAASIDIQGDKRNPEPSTAVIKFPGGHVEVSRTSTGEYWAHVAVTQTGSEDKPGRIVSSRLDYTHAAYVANGGAIPPLPADSHIQHMAVLIALGE